MCWVERGLKLVLDGAQKKQELGCSLIWRTVSFISTLLIRSVQKRLRKRKKSATLTLHSGLGSVLQIVYIVLVHTVQVLIWINKIVQNRHVQS